MITRQSLKIASRCNKIMLYNSASMLPFILGLPSNNISRTFSDKAHFEKITSYDNLNQRIFTSHSIEDALVILDSSLPLLRSDHMTAGVRAIARHLKQIDRDEVKRLAEDKRFITLVEKLKASFDSLTETCVIDLLFFFRKANRVFSQLGFSHLEINAVLKKCEVFIKDGKYNFNQLVNINYDISLLSRVSNPCLNEILQKLRAEPKVLTAFSCNLLINAAVAKQQKNGNEYVLLEYICRTTDIIITEFDNEQKSWVFRNLAKLEFCYNHPKFRNPHVIYQLKNHLKENLNQLSENAILNIISAYSFLNRDFPYDLLDEIKVMVMITLQHNSSNLKSSFLLDFLDRVSQLPRQRSLSADRVNNLLDEIAIRFDTDIYISRNSTKLLKIMKECRVGHLKLLKQIEELTINDPKAFINLQLIEALNAQNIDLSPILKSIKDKNSYERSNFTLLARLYLTLKNAKNFDYSEHVEMIEQMETFKTKQYDD